jgi:hypothetical protein
MLLLPRIFLGFHKHTWFVTLLYLMILSCHSYATDPRTEIDPYYWTIDVPAQIHISNAVDVATVRSNMINCIWKGKGWPGTNLPARVETIDTPPWLVRI